MPSFRRVDRVAQPDNSAEVDRAIALLKEAIKRAPNQFEGKQADVEVLGNNGSPCPGSRGDGNPVAELDRLAHHHGGYGRKQGDAEGGEGVLTLGHRHGGHNSRTQAGHGQLAHHFWAAVGGRGHGAAGGMARP